VEVLRVMAGWLRLVLWVLSVVVGLPAAGVSVLWRVRGVLFGVGLWWLFGVLGWVEVWGGPAGLPWIVAWPLGVTVGGWWLFVWVRLTVRAWSRANRVASSGK